MKLGKIPGWFWAGDINLYRSFAKKFSNATFAEIGVYHGRSAFSVSDICVENNNKIYCIDIWSQSKEIGRGKGTEIYNKFLENIKDENLEELLIPLRMTSLNAAKIFAEKKQKFEMVFIDGEHGYKAVKEDILAWKPLVKQGGILAGHDHHKDFPGIVKAVQELLPNAYTSGIDFKRKGNISSIWYTYIYS